MSRHLTVFTALLLGGSTAMVGVLPVALSQAPLQPVQHVYPDSTLEEIQQAIDNGGTVYFEYLTKGTRQYGEYRQVASSTPDLPPTAVNPAKGFNIGKYGKDVHIIGVLGDRGERPKIIGGTIVFRVGTWPGFGFSGLPANFKIENLELFNPDMGGPGALYSRVGIWVLNVIGKESTINNCKITITGKEADTGHVNNHSIGIFFFLGDAQSMVPTTQRPTSGARIDITNNIMAGSKIHEGIHVANFWPETPDFATPRAFISNNLLNLTGMRGFANKAGTDGATRNTAIQLSGNLSRSIVTNNVVTGAGRSPGLTPRQESVAIGLSGASPRDTYATSLTVVGNDSSSFAADFQMSVAPIFSWSTVARNLFGPGSHGGIVCDGHDNRFERNQFYGDYPGWDLLASGPGLVWFTKASTGNWLSGTRLNRGFDICGQVKDETRGANKILDCGRCP